MAWGMFLALPCPYKRWDEECRAHMLAALPLVGAIVGALWWAAGAYLFPHLPRALGALILAALPWLLTGFIHLDGYMDVCDAVLSRRDLAQRRQILKDPHCGAFGVIALVLLVSGQWCVFFCADGAAWHVLFFLPLAGRAGAALAVLHLRSMPGSQYDKISVKGIGITAIPALFLAASVITPLLVWHSAASLVCAAVYWLCVLYGARQLGGMNGDISGFALSLAELAGAAVLCLVG